MAYKQGKWYVVWVGTEPGICENWDECKARVLNYPNARYKGFNTQQEAIMAYRGDGKEEMKVLRAIANAQSSKVNYDAIPEIIKGSIAVDAACSHNPGVMEYRGVDISTGTELFHQGPFKNGTNNIGEFLAIVHALALFKQQGVNTAIYSDSRIAQLWVRDKKCKTKLVKNAANSKLFDIVARAEAWLRDNTYSNPIFKWQTDKWGEIPADFGRK
jgi:ribonuclease HI